jgi:hypothetical protein
MVAGKRAGQQMRSRLTGVQFCPFYAPMAIRARSLALPEERLRSGMASIKNVGGNGRPLDFLAKNSKFRPPWLSTNQHSSR